jgi:hypothetical protein
MEEDEQKNGKTPEPAPKGVRTEKPMEELRDPARGGKIIIIARARFKEIVKDPICPVNSVIDPIILEFKFNV